MRNSYTDHDMKLACIESRKIGFKYGFILAAGCALVLWGLL